jgi:hypothetical protein
VILYKKSKPNKQKVESTNLTFAHPAMNAGYVAWSPQTKFSSVVYESGLAASLNTASPLHKSAIVHVEA